MTGRFARAVPATVCVCVAVGLLAAGCGAPSGNRPVSEADTLRIVVYNIHHGAGMDEVIDLERIARLVRDQDPDLVALQEIDSVVTRTGGVDQAAELGRLTGLTPVFGRFMPYQGGAYGMAVLSRWPIVSSENVRLPDGEEPRTSVVATVRSPTTGRELRFADVHFYMTEAERLAQAQALVTRLDEMGGAVVMAGDFNSEPETPVISFVGSTLRQLDKGDDHFTFSSFDPVKEIDFVFVRPGGDFEVIEHHPLDEPVASDHRPLVATIVWNPAGDRIP